MTRIEDFDVLVACEESGVMRDALTAIGIRAISCDLKPTRRPGPHYHGPVQDILHLRHWRGLIAHPVCKFLANSGAKHLYRRVNGIWSKDHGRDPERWANMEAGARFFNLFRDADHIPMRAIENSIMHGHAIKLVGRRQDQCTQPWWFGEPFTKAAAWWLYGLPQLRREYGKSHYEKITPKCWLMTPGDDREQKRSETEPAVAAAVARQWGPYFLAPTPLELAMPFLSWASSVPSHHQDPTPWNPSGEAMLALAKRIESKEAGLVSERERMIIADALRLAAASPAPDPVRTALADAYAALRSIAEGNLGGGPGQANYATIKTVARNALPENQRDGATPQPLSNPLTAPDGYVLVPRELTAENGAKSALIGEFNEEFGFLDDDGEEQFAKVAVTWTTIKEIHKLMVKSLSLPAEGGAREGWQPIETAPKDGADDIDVWFVLSPTHGARWAGVRWSPEHSVWSGGPPSQREGGWTATHWMPRPTPPIPRPNSGGEA